MTENAAVVVGVDGSEGSRAALRWAAQEAHRRQLPLRIVAAAGLDAVTPATASESFRRHLSAHRSRHPTTPRCSSSVPVAAAGSPDCSSVRSATLCCTVHTARSP
jgi:nucleotide-binding universal stress UspA family protein